MADNLQRVLAFIKSTAVPAAASVAPEVSENVKSTMVPAAASGASVANEYLQSTVLPAAASKASVANEYLQSTVHPAASAAVAAGYHHLQTSIAPAAQASYKSALSALSSAVQHVEHIEISRVPHLTPLQSVLREKGLEAWNYHIGENFTLGEIIEPALKFLTPIVDYVIANPWVLLPLMIPAFQAVLFMIGFTEAGVLAGSIAAAIQAAMGNVPKNSIFAFLQSNGAKGWARQALRLGGMYLTIAVLLATVGKLLIDRGVIPDVFTPVFEQAWNSTLVRFGKGDEVTPPPMNSGSQESLGAGLLSTVLLGAGTFLAIL